ncbi:MAG: hypothetical protein R3328_03340 [Planococcaceae bacterium]|nr:hypothetical protein [Bacillota bacterium]MDX1770546.1 hypothetical protein [Planococcaceae bacterium]
MKKDFRVQYPLWQMAFIILFGFIAISLTGASSEMIQNDLEFSYSLQFPALESILLFITLAMTFILLIIFIMKITNHNKRHPQQKLSFWQIKPIEYLEEDEGMIYITRRAAQKVYTFFVWALPFVAMIYLLFNLSRLWIVIGILFLAFMQYLIFYIEVRKYLSKDED